MRLPTHCPLATLAKSLILLGERAGALTQDPVIKRKGLLDCRQSLQQGWVQTQQSNKWRSDSFGELEDCNVVGKIPLLELRMNRNLFYADF
jgi:hypothetical protein